MCHSMLYISSTPWLIKLVILLLNLMRTHRSKENSPTWTFLFFFALSIYLLSTFLPSVLSSVRERSSTTEYVQITTFMIANLYVLLCLMSHDAVAQLYTSITLQFAGLHILYSEYEVLRRKPHLLLFSPFVLYTHVCAIILFLACLSLRSPSIRFDQKDAVLVLGSLFVGEILGCCAYVQYVLTRVCGEVYERCMHSFFAF